MFRTLLCCLLFCTFIPCTAPLSTASEPPRHFSYPSRSAAAPNEKKPFRNADKPPLVIRDIRFQREKGAKEKVLIFSNRFFTPSVSALEGERPRFVIDIRNTDSVRDGLKNIPADGVFIKKIRTHHDRDTGTLRIVLDLSPEENYSVNQTFFEAENLYVIDVAQESEKTEK